MFLSGVNTVKNVLCTRLGPDFFCSTNGFEPDETALRTSLLALGDLSQQAQTKAWKNYFSENRPVIFKKLTKDLDVLGYFRRLFEGTKTFRKGCAEGLNYKRRFVNSCSRGIHAHSKHSWIGSNAL